jgi:hypothetical protein
MDQQTQQQQLQQPPPRAEHPGFQVPASPVYPSNPELNSSAEKPPKRRKVAIACDECRVRYSYSILYFNILEEPISKSDFG